MFVNDIPQLPKNDNDFISPIVCPICGCRVIEFIYAFECEDCEWNEPKEVEE